MAVYEEKWYTNSTSVGPYSFTFPYIKEADVKVEKNGTLLTPTTEYTQGFTEITLISAPLSTDIIRIYRDTDKDFLSSTFYPGSAIRSSDLNDNFTQNLYSSQESAENARDAIRATDAFIATTSDEGDTWVTTGYGTTHGQDPNTDPKGIGYAVTTSEAADGKADAAVETADDAELLVHTYVADGNGNLKGDGISPNPQGVKYAVVTAEDAEDVADEARDTYAIPAKQATDALVGTTTDNGQTWTLRGDGISPNPQGVAYAVGKADDALANSRLADGATPASPSGGYTSAIYLADQADTNSTSALDNSRISTGGTPAGPSGGYTSAIYLADQADTNATDAVSTANAAQANSRIADGATPAAPSGGYTSAIYLADAALDNSRESDGSGGYNSAISIANNAERATDRLVATTADDGLTWTLTGGNTNASTDPKGVKYAVETAEAAQSAVAASGLYTIVANFAALPALTDASLDNDNQNSLLYQISDSTDIEDESTLNGEPAGFTGDDELTVKLKANITASPKRWDWQEYYATDPETRYRKKLIVENLITISETYTIGTGNNAHSVGPVTISHNGTDLTYNAENHAQPYVALNAATAGNTVTIPENSTWLIN